MVNDGRFFFRVGTRGVDYAVSVDTADELEDVLALMKLFVQKFKNELSREQRNQPTDDKPDEESI